MAIYALMLSAIVGIVLGPVLIPLLRRLKFGQTERELGPKTHLVKQGTPTMGGVMILASILTASLAFGLSATEFMLPALLIVCAFALIGFMDDFMKVKYKNSVGLRGYQKIIAQFCIALVLSLYAYNSPFIGSSLFVPIINAEWDLGVYYIPFMIFVILAIVNGTNLTDGLDGLASGVTLIYAITLSGIFIYLSAAALQPASAGQASQFQYSAELNSMSVFAAAVAGGCMGFLRYNAFPARVFMGDTGSLALGGAISVMAIFSRTVLLFPIMGICFVASCVSVVLQVGSYKLTRKRIFKMAPLHHHYELKGYSETKIVSVYMIITAFCCLLCLLVYV